MDKEIGLAPRIGLIRFFTQLTQQKWNYVASFVVDIASVLVLALVSVLTATSGPEWRHAVAVLLGALTWTFYEYVFHRWVFHGRATGSLKAGHSKHHQNVDLLLSMPFFTGPAIYAFLFFMVRFAAGDSAAAAYTGAYALSYVYYGAMHHSSHFMDLNLGFWKRMRDHHLLHHTYPDKNYGFTTTFWDRVFGTLVHPQSEAE